MKRVLLGTAIVVVAVVTAVYGVGYALPATHTYTRTVEFNASVDELWRHVRDFEAVPDWWSYVESVRRLDDRDGIPRYRQVTAEGTIDILVVESVPPARLTTAIVDRSDFGGKWTYVLEPTNGGARLTLREDGEIHHPVYRFFAHFVFGIEGTVDSYLAALALQVLEPAPGQVGLNGSRSCAAYARG